MNAAMKITVWAGCDPQLADAINSFSEKWGPYSSASRRHSIFSLMRDLIDPAWYDLHHRYPAINRDSLDAAWKRYQWERYWHLAPEGSEKESPEQRKARAKKPFIPCSGIVNGDYALSAIARHHGFIALERFIQLTAKSIRGCDYEDAALACINSLRSLSLACGLKKPKKKTHGKINAQREHLHLFCQLCGQKTELSAYIEGNTWPQEDAEDECLRLSSIYCAAHRPKAPFSDSIKAEYFRAKRSKSKFDEEFFRLERQSWSMSVSVPWAESGNTWVDEYICRLVAHRRLTLGQDESEMEAFEGKLRNEARMLVDRKISDRKKEIVMLLASGLNQAAIALRLGVKRQAVSKVLQSIPAAYRLDQLTDIHCDAAACRL